MKRVKVFILFFVIFYNGLSYSAYAPTSHIKTAISKCPPSGVITIGLSGQASDYRSPVKGYYCSAEKLDSKQRAQCLNEKKELEQKAFEQKAQLQLKKSFYLPQCEFKFEFNGNKNKVGQRLNGCEVEVQGPGSDFPRSSSGMTDFYQLLRNSNYNIQKCDKVSYSYRFRDSKTKIDPSKMSPKNEVPTGKSSATNGGSRGSGGEGRSVRSDNSGQDQSRTDAIGECLECSSAPHTGPLDRLIQLSRSQDWKRSTAPTCEPQGYDRGLSKQEVREMAKSGALVEAIKRYSENAQGAIKRAFIAIVKPESMELARKLTNNFESFNHLSPNQISEIVNTAAYGKCYQFVKAALSGDYSIIQQRNQAETQAVAQRRSKGVKTIVNVPLLENQCNINRGRSNKGDLALSHRGDWTHDDSDKDYSSYAAGNAGPDLEKRGFINILDPEYGLAKNFIGVDGRVDESLLPEGAVIVHQCNYTRNPNNNFENYRNPYRPGKASTQKEDRCNLGDISLKTTNGFISSYYGETPITRRHKYVVVGVYVKPMKEASL